jgi:hypothetical protein
MDDLKIFIPFSKKDDDLRQVNGYASTEALDSQDEIIEKDAIARALPGYLGEFDQKTGKYRYGGLREMHQLSAVGKTMKAKIDKKGLFIQGKVVDDNAWKKVKEGVYAGFSVGGKIVKQVGNRIKDLKLSEISLVDRPANPEAIFTMIKIDKTGKVEDMQRQTAVIAKGAYDTRILSSMILALEDMSNREERENDTQTIDAITAAITALKEAAANEIMEPAGTDSNDRPMLIMANLNHNIKKGSDDAMILVSIIQALEDMVEIETDEGDDVSVKAMNRAIGSLKQAAIYEIGEVDTGDDDEMEQAEKILELAKDMRKLMKAFEMQGKSTYEFMKSLNMFKDLADRVLDKDYKKKFDLIMYGMDFDELGDLAKAKLPFKDRKNMSSGSFAYIDSKGGKHLPIHDKAHAQNAMARFNQTQFESPAKRAEAARKILAAARRFGITIDPSSSVAQAAKKAEIGEVNKYVDKNWTTGYFEQMKKVLGWEYEKRRRRDQRRTRWRYWGTDWG